MSFLKKLFGKRSGEETPKSHATKENDKEKSNEEKSDISSGGTDNDSQSESTSAHDSNSSKGKVSSAAGTTPAADSTNTSPSAAAPKSPPPPVNTASSVTTTSVSWYWQDVNGVWVEYGNNSQKNSKALVTSHDIEDFYQKNPGKNFQFQTSEGQSYTLDFANGCQINDAFDTKKSISRGSPPQTGATMTPVSPPKTSNAPTSSVKWYFKDEHGNWIEYGHNNSNANSKATLTSDNIETFYQSNPGKSLQFQASNGQSYTLDFVNNCQINDKYGTKKDVKREDGKSSVILNVTAASGNAPPSSNVKWYFQDEDQNWIEYGVNNTKANTKASVTSDDIEHFYQTNPGQDFNFKASNGQSYIIDFKNGWQMNEEFGTKKVVRRGDQQKQLGNKKDSTKASIQQQKQKPQNVTWYWKDEHGNWNKYGEVNTKGSTKALITSVAVEKLYQANSMGTATFKSSEGQEYKLDFEKNCQINVKYNTTKEIKRVENQGTTYPLHWDDMIDKETFKLIDVDPKSDEFVKTAQLFENSSGGPKCKKLQRIQNKKVWKIFQAHREEMTIMYEKKEKVNEQLLFHGSKYSAIKTICKENLDSRRRGVNGTKYGQGVYFAKKSSYSVTYAHSSSNNERAMFLFRVLVGTTVVGNSNMMYPPYTPENPEVKYDTTVDDVTNPTIFVKYYDHTYYPEYVIEF